MLNIKHQKTMILRIHATILMACCLALPVGVHTARAQQPLHIVYPDYYPFFSENDLKGMNGFFYEIVTEALTRMDIAVEWEAKPWSRCQVDVSVGDADAMITVPTEERLKYSHTHQEPFYRKTMNVFTYVGHPRMDEIMAITSLEDIRRANLSIITYTGNGWHKKHVTPLGIATQESPCLECIWSMLAYQRGDIIIEWPTASWSTIRELGIEKEVVDTGVVVASMPFHLLIGKLSPHANVVDRFDEVIAAMRADGTINAILDNYR